MFNNSAQVSLTFSHFNFMFILFPRSSGQHIWFSPHFHPLTVVVKQVKLCSKVGISARVSTGRKTQHSIHYSTLTVSYIQVTGTDRCAPLPLSQTFHTTLQTTSKESLLRGKNVLFQYRKTVVCGVG